MSKAVIDILQGSLLTQTKSGELTMYPAVANFLQ